MYYCDKCGCLIDEAQADKSLEATRGTCIFCEDCFKEWVKEPLFFIDLFFGG